MGEHHHVLAEDRGFCYGFAGVYDEQDLESARRYADQLAADDADLAATYVVACDRDPVPCRRWHDEVREDFPAKLQLIEPHRRRAAG